MDFILYDTFTKHDQVFSPLTPGKVGMYTCGPTVYGRPHIGNYSSFLMADLLRRWLEAGHGYEVTHVKNITDVGHLVADEDTGEDKIERQAREEKTDPLAIARKYTEQYLMDEKELHMLEPAFRPLATETIKGMVAIIKDLQAKGHAYETDDGIYYAVETFPAYGKLSGNTLDKLSAGARITVDERKRHPADFALWKKTVGANGRHLLRWAFATGERADGVGEDGSTGFPGWHIECSAMSRQYLGETFDIHTGGEDNIFPHHECEIAQSEASTGKPFVRYWLHKRRIDLAGEKMSKSLGNVLTLPDVVSKGYSALDLRYYLLSVHYRTNLKFAWKGMDDARKARTRITEWMEAVEKAEASSGAGEESDAGTKAQHAFRNAMNADLNTPSALAAVFDAMAEWHRSAHHSAKSLKQYRDFILLVRHTFGCFDAPREESVPADVVRLADERAHARTAKNFAESDRLRDAIAALGWGVKDTAQGQQLKKL